MNIRPFKQKTVGLCLGGGGARGLSHIGVLKALAEHHITPTHISGTSMGAIIAVLYASGYSIDHMVHTAKHLGRKQILPDWRDFWQQRKKGLLSTKYLHQVLQELEYHTIESLPIPTRISTTSISTGRNILHQEGNIVDLVTASAAIPGLFAPVTYQGQLLADGGIANNFPLEPLLHCDLIIGSDVNYYEPPTKKLSTQDLLAKSIAISLNQSTIVKQDQCHLFIQPTQLSSYHILDFDNTDAIIELGYQETCNQLLQRPHLI